MKGHRCREDKIIGVLKEIVAGAAIASVGANTTSHLDTPLAPATAYTRRVRARNAGGASGYVELTVQTAAAEA